MIGSEPSLADLVLDENDIDGKQAQLYHQDGDFWLRDLNSAEGTWVNYERISKNPQKLKPGDVLHFGKHGFRFTIVDDLTAPIVVVRKYKPLL